MCKTKKEEEIQWKEIMRWPVLCHRVRLNLTQICPELVVIIFSVQISSACLHTPFSFGKGLEGRERGRDCCLLKANTMEPALVEVTSRHQIFPSVESSCCLFVFGEGRNVWNCIWVLSEAVFVVIFTRGLLISVATDIWESGV